MVLLSIRLKGDTEEVDVLNNYHNDGQESGKNKNHGSVMIDERPMDANSICCHHLHSGIKYDNNISNNGEKPYYSDHNVVFLLGHKPDVAVVVGEEHRTIKTHKGDKQRRATGETLGSGNDITFHSFGIRINQGVDDHRQCHYINSNRRYNITNQQID